MIYHYRSVFAENKLILKRYTRKRDYDAVVFSFHPVTKFCVINLDFDTSQGNSFADIVSRTALEFRDGNNLTSVIHMWICYGKIFNIFVNPLCCLIFTYQIERDLMYC